MKVSSSLILFVFVSVILTQANAHRSSDQSSSHPRCPAKKYWNEKKKACVCRPEHKCFPAGGQFDKETCTYIECKEKTCDDNKYFDRKICDCECKDQTLKDSCPAGKSWNNQTCSCECSNAAIPCPNPQVHNNATCECGCPSLGMCPSGKSWNNQTCKCECSAPPPAKCPGNQVSNNEICQCTCPDLASQNSCPSGKSWNNQICSCECNYGCPDYLVQNNETCECTCPDGQPQICEQLEIDAPGWCFCR